MSKSNKNKVIKMANAENLDSTKVAELTQSLKTAQEQSLAWQTVAGEAAQNLFLIESRFAPILNKKFNFFTALMHLQMYIELIREVVELIRNFRTKYTPKTDGAPAN